MQKSKTFTQYKDDNINIGVIINTNGSFFRKSRIYYLNTFKKYYDNNKKERIEYGKKYYILNKNKHKKIGYRWRKNNPDKVRIHSQNTHNKRRNYGFKPLNNWFEGSHFHHLHIDNHDNGIFIPGYIHNNIWHSPNNKESMIKINKLAFEYLENQKCD